MKRFLFFIVAIATFMPMVSAYDFSATVPSGQTLYFSYLSGGGVYVTYSYNSSEPYYGVTKPSGALVIPGSVMYNGVKWDIKSIGRSAFYDCDELTSVVVSDSITSIGDYAFGYCNGITSVDVGDGVTSIDYCAFKSCSSLSTLTMGRGIVQIGSYSTSNDYGAFSNCPSLSIITIYATSVPSTYGNTFYGVSTNATVNVPCGTLEAYSTAIGWSQFNNIIEMSATYTASVSSANSTMGTANVNICGNIITATANNGYHFDQWNDGNIDNPRTLALTENTSFTAYFAPNQYTVSVSTTGNGTSTGSGTIAYLEYDTLTATPSVGYTFKGWKKKLGGTWGTDYYSTDNPLTVQVTENMQFQAVFERTKHMVNAVANDSVMGYVTGGGEVEYGSYVSLYAYARTGYRFTGWSDGYASNVKSVYVTSDTTLTANFEVIPQYTLSLGVNNAAMGNVSGGGTYYEGTNVSFSATVNTGYRFTGWSDGIASATRSITMTADTTISANFEYIDYAVRAQSGNTLRGMVEGSDTVHYGETVTLTATAYEHYVFQYWQTAGGEIYGQNPLTITVTSNGVYTAVFVAEQHSVQVLTDGGGTVRIGSSGNSGNYDYFSQLTLTATANGNNAFLRWSDGNTFNPRTVTITSDTVFTALFLNGTTYLHDTIIDTVYFNHYTHDTTFINNYVHDTIYLYQTLYENIHDTLVQYVNQYIHDTIFVNNYVHDTVRITTLMFDTTIVNIYQFDTAIYNTYNYDTIIINNQYYDTVFVHLHDTIYITEQGIGGVDGLNAKVYSSQGQIVVEGAEGNAVWLYDVTGRVLAIKQDNYTPLRFDAPASGTYMIKIGNYAARRVVVVR